jgi:hypothetical protein
MFEIRIPRARRRTHSLSPVYLSADADEERRERELEQQLVELRVSVLQLRMSPVKDMHIYFFCVVVENYFFWPISVESSQNLSFFCMGRKLSENDLKTI